MIVQGSHRTCSDGYNAAGFRGSPRSRRSSYVLQNYLPILIFLAVAGGFGVVLLSLGWVLGAAPAGHREALAYECGFEAFEDARMKFDVRYYLVAILFIIFDLEIAFLFPWAVSLDAIGGFGCSRW